MVYLFYEENQYGQLKYDPVSVTGYVDNDVFVVTNNEEMYDSDGKPLKYMKLNESDKNNIFETMDDACDFLLQKYGFYAMCHYIKNMDEFA